MAWRPSASGQFVDQSRRGHSVTDDDQRLAHGISLLGLRDAIGFIREAFEFECRFLYDEWMKTTLDIDDELLVKAKALSARERTTLTALIEEGLRLRLRRPGSTKRTKPLMIHRGKGGLASGVDPLSNRSLLDAADDA